MVERALGRTWTENKFVAEGESVGWSVDRF